MTATWSPAPIAEGMWVADELAGSPLPHNTGIAVRTPRPLNPDLLQQAIDSVSSRHAMLRATWQLDGSFDLVVFDTGHGPVLQRQADPTSIPALHLADEPAWWAGLTAESVPRLLLVFHHAVVDPWSLALTVREIQAAYHALETGASTSLEEPASDYQSYVALMRERAERPEDECLSFWRGVLAGVAPLPPHLARMVRSNTRQYGGSFRLDISHHRETIRAAARRHRATPFAVMLAVCGRAAQRYAATDEILVAVPVCNREIPDADRIVGCFTEVLPVPVSAAGSLDDLIDRTLVAVASALDHQIPYQTIAARCAPTERAGHTLDELCSVTTYPAIPAGGDGWLVESLDVPAVGRAVTFAFEAGDTELKLVLHYGRGITHDDAQGIVDHTLRLIGTLSRP